jgi:hypothetical protein
VLGEPVSVLRTNPGAGKGSRGRIVLGLNLVGIIVRLWLDLVVCLWLDLVVCLLLDLVVRL